MRSITWFETIAGNQRTWSRAFCTGMDIGDVAENALLVNISGHMRDGWLKRAFAKRVYVDIDPSRDLGGYVDSAKAAGLS